MLKENYLDELPLEEDVGLKEVLCMGEHWNDLTDKTFLRRQQSAFTSSK